MSGVMELHDEIERLREEVETLKALLREAVEVLAWMENRDDTKLYTRIRDVLGEGDGR